MLVKAIRDEGNVDLIIYGKHTDIDTLTLMEVEGKIKNENRKYLIVESVNILDRFDKIRGSFSKLSLAMFFLEITYRTNSGLKILLDGLERLKEWDTHSSLVYFLYKFLQENGVLDLNKLSPSEIDIIETLMRQKNRPLQKIDKNSLNLLKNKLMKEALNYVSQPLNTLKMLRLS